MTMFERPSCDVDSTWRMPSTVLIALLDRLVTSRSTVSGEAPGVDGGDGDDRELDVGELVARLSWR